MAVTFRPLPISPTTGPHVIGDLYLWVGTLTFSGNYVTGGEVVVLPSPSPSGGLLLASFIQGPQGYLFRYDPATRRVLGYSAARTQLTGASAYPTEISGDTTYALFIYQ